MIRRQHNKMSLFKRTAYDMYCILTMRCEIQVLTQSVEIHAFEAGLQFGYEDGRWPLPEECQQLLLETLQHTLKVSGTGQSQHC